MGSRLYKCLVFCLPLLYAIQTRFLRRSKLGVIVWATEYLMPLLLAMFLLNFESYSLTIAFLSIVASYNLYEIGYIQNDCETIKQEKKPTKRLTHDDLDFYERNKLTIYIVRLLIELMLCYYLYTTGASIICIVFLWFIVPYFVLYNALRGRINLYLILPLTSWRYCFPVFLYGDIMDVSILCSIIICVFFAYPFPTFIEICSDGKGCSPEKWTRFFLNNFSDRFLFRIKYYVIMFLIYLILSICYVVPSYELLIPFYYLIIRIPQLWMKKMGDK